MAHNVTFIHSKESPVFTCFLLKYSSLILGSLHIKVMTTSLLFSSKAITCLLFLIIAIGCARSARNLDEVDPQPQIITGPLGPTNPGRALVPNVAGPANTLPGGGVPVAAPATVDESTDSPLPDNDDTAGPVAEVAPAAPEDTNAPEPEAPSIVATPVANVAPTVTIPAPGGATTVATTTAVAAKPGAGPQLSFFMHDILGGSHPSSRVVTGIIANSGANGLPFSKPNNNIFPINGGVPLVNSNLNGLINNNNLPSLTGLNGGQANTIIQNSGNNNQVSGGNNQPFITAGQLPAGATLQQLMFGTITVIDNELTEGHELGSSVLGKAQGFYLASSLDGTSHTMALTVLFPGSDHEIDDTISFFGVHRTASVESQVAIVGGTGKYEHAKGYATVETLPQEDQHTTDGVDTILHFNVFFSE
ncbi:dirigent protein 24-like [Syzygium oleosum]|uniref:dirigent protein 24-like n=1 Tax=Syzygium oleosum TaxID=219896 RepID=UPI0011D2A6D9|nr:dirigent protein 24-like [Syzygium oleosum]